MSGLRVKLQWHRPGFDLNAEFNLPTRGITALFGPSG